jgi:hypothetical protein
VEGLRKATRNLTIAGVPAEIQTEYLPNTSLKRYRHANLLGDALKFTMNFLLF